MLGFCVSGYFLAVELSSVAMQRRGIPVRERLRILRGRRALALGFGVPLVLMFLVPLVAVVLMPGAVAGAAMLVRDLTGEADEQRNEDVPDAGGPGAPSAGGPGGGGPGAGGPGTPDPAPPANDPRSSASYW